MNDSEKFMSWVNSLVLTNRLFYSKVGYILNNLLKQREVDLAQNCIVDNLQWNHLRSACLPW